MKTMSTPCLFQMQVSTWRLCYPIDNLCPYAPRDDQKVPYEILRLFGTEHSSETA
jgi:hypothetical protein